MKQRKKVLLGLILSCSLLLTSCEADKLGEDISSSIQENLVPNLYSTLAQILATAIMFTLIIVFAYKPAKKFLNKRREKLDGEVKEAYSKNMEASKNVKTSEENLALSKVEAKRIVDDATKEAHKKEALILEQAENERKKIVEDGRLQIEKEREETVAEIKNMVVDVAFDASEKILEREISKKDNEKIIDDFVKEINEDKDK
jgi:F-type H+-transporting ATPase subunit b